MENHKEAKEDYEKELGKFIGKEVIVEKINGKIVKGTMKAYNPIHLNVVITTPTQKLVIRNISSISRKRDLSWKKKGGKR